MTKAKNKINLDQIESTVSTTFKELEEGIKSSDLTSEEWAEIKIEIGELEFKAYRLKIGLHLKGLIESAPDMPIRDVIIRLLAHLRPDASPSMVAQVTKYIAEEWEKKTMKVAA